MTSTALKRRKFDKSKHQLKVNFFSRWKTIVNGWYQISFKTQFLNLLLDRTNSRRDFEKEKLRNARKKIMTVQAFIANIEKDLKYDIDLVGDFYRDKFVNAVMKVIVIIR